MCKLVFDQEKYTVETVTMEGQTLTYRAYEDIPYVTNPVDDKMERLSIFVPEVFYEGKSVNGYNLENAPIFCRIQSADICRDHRNDRERIYMGRQMQHFSRYFMDML